ncbi:hypothetical protein G6O69_03715 [Pseudenhygromyxa sp. WMMC2535]|uniref:hypothetical protein n=1 Tax=Pseudenhygromyxa sp. WMMC2535 TaxID=2712867 RepID=UPI0015952367|nr:hypothetical protein [Pseudenhygromyxa sp. WMMC2535]NVB36923.1 hypothetical protein [Pseudenhygromyxa sp. WMMC2535]
MPHTIDIVATASGIFSVFFVAFACLIQHGRRGGGGGVDNRVFRTGAMKTRQIRPQLRRAAQGVTEGSVSGQSQPRLAAC